MLDNTLTTCPFCNQITQIINVHGHYQCEHCHKNIEECCQGEQVDG